MSIKSAGIIINTSCNLRCPYCFESTLKKETAKYITRKDYDSSVEMLQKAGVNVLKILGGEPLLHPDFEYLIKKAVDRFENVLLLTNGILLQNFLGVLRHDKIIVLINYNSMPIISSRLMIDELNLGVERLSSIKPESVSLGLNLYSSEQNVIEFVKFAHKINAHTFRLSTASNSVVDGVYNDPFIFYNSLKDKFFELCSLGKEFDLKPIRDCDFFPACTFTSAEIEAIDFYLGDGYFNKNLYRMKTCSIRHTVNILPDMYTYNCFCDLSLDLCMGLSWNDVLGEYIDFGSKYQRKMLKPNCASCSFSRSCSICRKYYEFKE